VSTAPEQEAYHAYGEVTSFKNYRGESMPPWDELPEKIKHAWKAAALAASFAYEAQHEAQDEAQDDE